MTIKQQIQQILDEVKTLPNSLERNKTMSHLQDAKVWAMQLRQSPADEIAELCTCFPGTLDKSCPVHGG